jgi:hypothetical protein
LTIMAHAKRRKTTEVPQHNHYLQRRRQTWYIRVAVPPKLAPVVHKTHIVRSLKTRDVAVARERRWAALAEIKRWLSAQGSPQEDIWSGGHWFSGTIDPVAEGIKDRDWRLSTDDRFPDPDTKHTERDDAKWVITDRAEEIEAKQGPEDAMTYFRVATSEDPVLQEVERRWLEQVSSEVAGQTLGHYRFALKLLHQYDANLLLVSQVNRRFAARFIAEAVRPGKAPRTVNRIISGLSAFWRWMRSQGLAESNPWEGHGKKKDKNGAKPKRPYNRNELLRLFHADPVSILGERYGHAIHDFFVLV